jgi:hypothetical protein
VVVLVQELLHLQLPPRGDRRVTTVSALTQFVAFTLFSTVYWSLTNLAREHATVLV